MKDKIKQIVSDVYGVDMTNRTRDRCFVEARQAFCYFCRLMTSIGLDEIGEAVGINHSTVTYGAKHYGEILRYPDVNERYLMIEFILGLRDENRHGGIDHMTGLINEKQKAITKQNRKNMKSDTTDKRLPFYFTVTFNSYDEKAEFLESIGINGDDVFITSDRFIKQISE